jgi:hypothetical protein
MSITILQGLATEWALLHHVDESWFKFETVISDVHLWTNPDVGTESSWEMLMHFWAAIRAGSCGGGDLQNLSTIYRTWDPEDPGEESLERDFRIRDFGSEW